MRRSLVPELSRLVSALMAVGLIAGTGCRGPGPSVEDDESALRFGDRPPEECCQRQFPPGRHRNECLDEARHGRRVRECQPRRDAGVADGHGSVPDASAQDARPDRGSDVPDASAKDARADLSSNVPDGSAKDAIVASCPTIAVPVPNRQGALPLGGREDLVATVTDPNATDTLTFSWTSTGGQLDMLSNDANIAEFICTRVAIETVTVSVSNGTCGSSASVDVTCIACGDGVIEPGEDCDPPNSTPDGQILCDGTCHFLGTCGNGQLDPGEQCDPPNPGVCGNDCQSSVVCGDGVIGPGEQCDPPHQGPDGLQCGSNCQLLTCGNGVIDPGEQCDPPMSPMSLGGISIPGCTQSCQFSTCGNGVIDPGETCDFPNTGICANCQPTTCASCFSFSDPCQGLTGTALISCHDLLNCLLGGDAACFFISGGVANPANTACYCSDATCSAGANGACASDFNAVAGTTDPSAVVGLLNDPTSLLSQARNVAKRLASDASCDMFCRGF